MMTQFKNQRFAPGGNQISPDLENVLVNLKNVDPTVRIAAAVRCIEIGDEAHEVRDQIMHYLEDREVMVRIALAEALYSLGENQRSIRILNEALSEDDSLARLQAKHILQKFGYIIR